LAAQPGVLSFKDVDAAATDAQILGYEDAPTSGVQKRLIERVRFEYYDSANLPEALPLGSADLSALPRETYVLALTPGLLGSVFNASEERVTAATLAEGGYVELPDEPGWWLRSGRHVFDPARFYLPTSHTTPFGAVTTLEYDAHALPMTATVDPLDNRVDIDTDYATLSPTKMTEPNGNRAAVRLDEVGLVVATAAMGKDGAGEGDTLEDPTTIVDYDLFRFETTGKPGYARVRAREAHADPDTPWQETWVYFDGRGREILRKVRVAPGPAPELGPDGHVVRDEDGKPVMSEADPRWVATGRTVFNNKGDPIKKYEPYFSRTHEFEDEDDLVHWGVTPVFHYDALHRLIRTDFPDGSTSRVHRTPWTQTAWDQNDTVLDADNTWYAARQPGATPVPAAAEQRAATLTSAHAGTPRMAELDPLGRTYLTIEDLGGGEKVKTTTELDIQGNPLKVTDGRGNVVRRHVFDVAGRIIFQNSVKRWFLPDIYGNPIRTWDSRGHVLRFVYDALRRLTELWVQKDGGPEALVERTVYGEDHPNAAALNLRTRVYQRYDGAGLATNDGFDFKGNLLASSRRFARDWKAQLDWSHDPAPELEAESFSTSTVYDALNRPARATKPDNSEIRLNYNRAGLVESVEIRLRGSAAWTPFVTRIDYNPKGQRERIVYSNGILTEYAYDPKTFRLARITTTRKSDGATLQDLRYTYDPVGNIVQIEDRAHPTVYHNGEAIEPVCRYQVDALYRLTRAEGREHAGQNADLHQDHAGFPLVQAPHPNDAQALRCYREELFYDQVGNILKMIHDAGPGSWTRRYEVAADNNRLLSTSLPGDPEAGPYSATYTYDAHGNVTSMPHLPSISWDFRDQKRSVDLGGGGDVYFVYDAAGERVRKVWEHSGIVEDRRYLGGYEVYRRREGPHEGLVLERQTLHVNDGTRRIAMVETKTVEASATLPKPVLRARFQLGNHLDSATLELDEAGQVIGYEEYHPYGTTAYQAVKSGVQVSARRYRYCGKERDEETGLYYYGARYYAPWLGRWTSPDPAGMVDGPNLYVYARDNPIVFTDPSGRQSYNPWLPGTGKQGIHAIDDVMARGGTSNGTPTPAPSSPDKPPAAPRQDAAKPQGAVPEELLKAAESKQIKVPQDQLKQRVFSQEQAQFIIEYFLTAVDEFAKRDMPRRNALLLVAHAGVETSYGRVDPKHPNPNVEHHNFLSLQPTEAHQGPLLQMSVPTVPGKRDNGPGGKPTTPVPQFQDIRHSIVAQLEVAYGIGRKEKIPPYASLGAVLMNSEAMPATYANAADVANYAGKGNAYGGRLEEQHTRSQNIVGWMLSNLPAGMSKATLQWATELSAELRYQGSRRR
jgi:RHS repeat-associated protein